MGLAAAAVRERPIPWSRYSGVVTWKSRSRCEIVMPKRAIRVIKHIGMVPCVAECTVCNKQFVVPLTALKSVKGATAKLQRQFYQHECAKQEGSHAA
jgi:hypothetical protein